MDFSQYESLWKILFNIVCVRHQILMFTVSFFCDEIFFPTVFFVPFYISLCRPLLSSWLLFFLSSGCIAVTQRGRGEERRGREGGWVVWCVGGGGTQYKTRLRKRLCKHTLSLLYICFSLFSLSRCPSLPCAHSLTSSSLPLCCLCHPSFSSLPSATRSTRQWDRLLGRACERVRMHARACVRVRMRVSETERMWDLCESIFLPAHRIQWASLASQACTELGKCEKVCMWVSYTLTRSSTHLGS